MVVIILLIVVVIVVIITVVSASWSQDQGVSKLQGPGPGGVARLCRDNGKHGNY